MPAFTRWIAKDTGNGDPTDDANWDNFNPTAGITIDGIVIVSGVNSTRAMKGIAAHPDTNYLSAGRLLFYPDYDGPVGSASIPLSISLLSSQVEGTDAWSNMIYRARGDAWLHPVGGSFTPVTVDCPRQTKVHIVPHPLGFGQKCSMLAVKSGQMIVDGSTLALEPIFVLGPDAYLEVRSSSSNNIITANLYVYDGEVLWKSDADATWVVRSGFVRMEGLLKTGMTLIQLGGEFAYAPTTDPSAEKPNLRILGGVFDASESRYDIKVADRYVGPEGQILGNVLGTTTGFADLSYDFAKEWP